MEEGEGGTMGDKIKEFLYQCGEKLKRLNTYRTLAIMWLVLGIFVMGCGGISRLNYFCIWILLILEYADRAIDEENRRHRRNGR